MIALIIMIVVLYITIGLFLTGFLNISVNSGDSPLFYGTVIFWPLLFVASIILIIGNVPIRFGKKLGDKYLPSLDKFFNKLFE